MNRRDDEIDSMLWWLAAAPGLCISIATASAHGYWLDGGEFIAASTELGLSHPPGHPLAALVGRIFACLPLGSLSFRVALASACLAGIASAFFFSAFETTLRSLLPSKTLRVLLALGSTWWLSSAYGWWFQAVRPEVYALQAALIAIALRQMLTLETTWPWMGVHRFYVAALAMGLALANHHLLALLCLPAFAPTFARVFQHRGVRPLILAFVVGALGLATYVYLPLRAMAKPALNLGDPTTLDRFLWVVSAEAFQKNTGGGVPQPLWERFADVIVQLGTNLHPALPLLALGGVYVSFRISAARRVGIVWTLILFMHVLARAWLGFIRSNPDALGYLMPAFAAVVALTALFIAQGIATIDAAKSRSRPSIKSFLLAGTCCAVGGYGFARTNNDASLSKFIATDVFDDQDRRALPPRSVLIAFGPQSVFRYWGGEITEQLRPDITLVPAPFLTYPGLIGAIENAHPELKNLFVDMDHGVPRLSALQSLAIQRPIFVELDVRVPPFMIKTLAPYNYYYELIADGAVAEDERIGEKSQKSAYDALYSALRFQPTDPETQNHLLWSGYVNALYCAAFGDVKNATFWTQRALQINTHAQELRALAQALEHHVGKGPIDISPFIVEPR